MKFLNSLLLLLGILILNTQQIKVPECLTHVQIESVGKNTKNIVPHLYIKINQQHIRDGPFEQGLTFVVLDENTGEIKDVQTFDTSESQNDVDGMIQFIDDIEYQKIVLVGVQGEGSKLLNEKAYTALYTIGWNPKFKLEEGESFALVGKKGSRIPKPYRSSKNTYVAEDKCAISACQEERIGNQCRPLKWVKKCSNEVKDLANKINIHKHWDISIGQQGQVMHQFALQHSADFDLDLDCFEQNIVIGGSEIPQHEVTYDKQTKTLTFERHDKWLRRLGCDYAEDDKKIQWKCVIGLEITMAGISQHQYQIHLAKTLYKELQHKEITHIEHKNEEIKTKLNFCRDKHCNAFYPDEQTEYQRNEDIYMLVQIVDKKYKKYHIQPKQARIGHMNTFIISIDDTKPGQSIVHIRPSLQIENTEIEISSELKDTDNDTWLSKVVEYFHASSIFEKLDETLQLSVKQTVSTYHDISITQNEDDLDHN